MDVRTLEPDDAPELLELFETYEWWAGREVDDVREAIARTEIPIGVDKQGALVAAARVMTDYVYYATVYDVIVDDDRRGEGFGRGLMETVVEHPDLQEVPIVSLHCRRGLVPFYESIGFELIEGKREIPEGGTEEMVRMRYPSRD